MPERVAELDDINNNGAAMAKVRKVHLALTVLLLLGTASLLFFKRGEANPSHLTGAGAILTMAECLACHSEGSSRPISICLVDHCLYTNNHPMLHRYPPPGKEGKFAPLAEILAAGCVLENGKVTCLSCHNLVKPPPHLIREGDDLCYLCHLHLRSEPVKRR